MDMYKAALAAMKAEDEASRFSASTKEGKGMSTPRLIRPARGSASVSPRVTHFGEIRKGHQETAINRISDQA